jgi:hypothetical protein
MLALGKQTHRAFVHVKKRGRITHQPMRFSSSTNYRSSGVQKD